MAKETTYEEIARDLKIVFISRCIILWEKSLII